jgi:hypothetical protein
MYLIKIFIFVKLLCLVALEKSYYKHKIKTTKMMTSSMTTTTLADFSRFYHICYRAPVLWAQLQLGHPVRCKFGPSGNACRNNSQCHGLTKKVCCQDADGCNQCIGNYVIFKEQHDYNTDVFCLIEPCPKVIVRPSDCENGYTIGDLNVGCLKLVCI